MSKKILIVTFYAIFFLVACNDTSDAQPSENLPKQIEVDADITGTPNALHALGIGAVKIGLTSDQIEGLGYPYEKKVVNLEGDEYVKYRMALSDEVEISVLMTLERRVYSITTSSIAIRDEHGNGIGSEIESLEKSYPNGRLIKGYADGKYLRFLTDSPLIFLMDKSQVPENCFEFEAECDFSKYSKVIALEVGKYSPS